MIKSDEFLFIGTAAFFVAMFGVLQIAGWRSKRAIVGGAQRFAQVVIAIGLGATVVLVLLLLVVTSDLQLFRGWPFILLYSLSVLGPLVVPTMLAIEVILVVELCFAQRVSRGLRLWHIGALLCCAS